MTTPLSPSDWLSELNKRILASSARAEGKPVTLEKGFQILREALLDTRARDANVWWVGNGGSAALCAHLSQDLLNKLKLRSQAFADASLITCMANDFGYAQVYAKPLAALARPGDLLIAISSSGKSENILACARLAREKDMRLVTLSGFKADNPLWSMPADVAFYLPAELYGQVEIGHEALLHGVIETLWLEETAMKEAVSKRGLS